jgi:bifunctional DNA-binding transcriptional regulator/antitoxin component of YhaV-PrlF toxin-antitoxin module
LSGGIIPKIYKQKNGKYIIYLPFEVINALSLKEDDELDFFKFGSNAFIMAKKSDIASLLSKNIQAPQEQKEQKQERGLSEIEVNVLKKLDTLRYNMRSKQNVEKLLNENERNVLAGLVKRKIVALYSKDSTKASLYSISKEFYDRFLMRKKPQQEAKVQSIDIAKDLGVSKELESRYGIEHEDVKTLESKGFVVLQTEAEASSLSLALEESIKQGLILGTRSFNKKFYIVLRSFFDKYSGSIIKELRNGDSRASDLAKKLGMDEEGARGILYLLAESGDVSEKRRDLFTLT